MIEFDDVSFNLKLLTALQRATLSVIIELARRPPAPQNKQMSLPQGGRELLLVRQN
jgi:hypothetical protein